MKWLLKNAFGLYFGAITLLMLVFIYIAICENYPFTAIISSISFVGMLSATIHEFWKTGKWYWECRIEPAQFFEGNIGPDAFGHFDKNGIWIPNGVENEE